MDQENSKLKVEIKTPNTQKTARKERDRYCIKCNDCKNKLVEIIITSSNQDLVDLGFQKMNTNIQILCGICSSGRSSIKHVEGLFHIGSCSDDLVLDVIDETPENIDVLYKVVLM